MLLLLIYMSNLYYIHISFLYFWHGVFDRSLVIKSLRYGMLLAFAKVFNPEDTEMHCKVFSSFFFF